jgi:hypothetical protein
VFNRYTLTAPGVGDLMYLSVNDRGRIAYPAIDKRKQVGIMSVPNLV